MGRPMKFPYTLSAKWAQFPFLFYVKNNWVWRHWVIGFMITVPVFYKIGAAARCPENYKNLEEFRRKEREEWEHHGH